MIASVRGLIIEKGLDHVVVETGGVGYEIFLPAADVNAAKQGAETHYLVYEHLREDIHALYGFSSAEAKQLFTMLIGISGIGPKVGMAILSSAGLTQLKNAISAGDADLLKGVAGVGKKTAERVVLELKGKLAPAGSGSTLIGQDSVYQALLGLGYNAAQAAEAVAAVPADLKDEQARLKAALKGLGK